MQFHAYRLNNGLGNEGFLTISKRCRTAGGEAICTMLAPLNSLNSTPLNSSHRINSSKVGVLFDRSKFLDDLQKTKGIKEIQTLFFLNCDFKLGNQLVKFCTKFLPFCRTVEMPNLFQIFGTTKQTIFLTSYQFFVILPIYHFFKISQK